MTELRCDVVVVGYGGAGAVAAIEAADAGADVIVLEGSDDGGGSTRASGGTLRILRDEKKAVDYFHSLANGTTPRPVMEAFARGVMRIPEWIVAHGGEVEEVIHDAPDSPYKSEAFPYMSKSTPFPAYGGSEALGGRLRIPSRDGSAGGPSLWAFLSRNVAERPIRVMFETVASRLVRSADGVVAVEATTADGPLTVHASRAVVLTCGGFAHDPEMQKQFLGLQLPSISPPWTNKGDGIRMAVDVGADLWHMKSAVGHFGYTIEGHEGGSALTHVVSKGFFVVDQRGSRYYNEKEFETHGSLLVTDLVDPVEGRYLRIPSYLVFDEATRLAGPITNRTNLDSGAFTWSADNSAEIERGWIKRAATFGELADALGLPRAQLERTAEEYNRAAAGEPDALGRGAATMAPLAHPPFYGIEIWPVLVNTQGGPRRNEKAQVLDVRGNPIPRLYAAGELGSIWSQLYPGAGNVTECLVYGSIAGRNAAGERPLAD